MTVCCGVFADMIIGPFFFEDEAAETVTINLEHDRDMISDFLIPIVRDSGIEHFWFQ